MEHIHQTLYLHVDMGFSYYLIVDLMSAYLTDGRQNGKR